MLFNIHRLTWDEEILKLLNIPECMLPEVKENSTVYGYTQPDVFFGCKVPIAAMAGINKLHFLAHLLLKKA